MLVNGLKVTYLYIMYIPFMPIASSNTNGRTNVPLTAIGRPHELRHIHCWVTIIDGLQKASHLDVNVVSTCKFSLGIIDPTLEFQLTLA